jgi:hypothetical protein
MCQRGRNARPRGKAIGEAAGTHQRSRRLSGRFLGSHIMDEASPQAGIGHAIAGSRLGKALPTRQLPASRHLHLAHLFMALDGVQIPMVGPIYELPIGQPFQILVEQTILGQARPAHQCLGGT